MPILAFRVSTYSRAIYLYGTNRLTQRDGYSGAAEAYYVPVEQYAAANYTVEQIGHALSSGWITQQEYDETVSYM